KVLLVDANLRNPSLHKLFKLNNEKGLAGFLAGESVIGLDEGEPALPTNIPNLFVIPAGSELHCSTDFLESARMRDLLGSFSGVYDRIVIDSSPLSEGVASSVLAPYMDAVLLVVRPGKTPREQFLETTTRLKLMNGLVAGVVMNYPARK